MGSLQTNSGPLTPTLSKTTSDAEKPQDVDNVAEKENESGGAPSPEPPTPSLEPSSPEPEKPHGLQMILIMSAVLMTQFLVSLDQTIVATAIPRITDEFHGLDKVSWYGSAYFMTFSGTLPCWGKALVYFRLKHIFLLALFVFELGSLICAVAPNANVLIIGRAIAGLGCSGVGTGAFLFVALAAAPRRRAKLLGLVISTYGIGAVCGPLIGGGFTANVSWRWCFYINLPIGGLAALFTVLSFNVHVDPLPARFSEKVLQLDLGGAAVLMGGIIAFTLALQYGGQTMAWDSSVVVGLLVGFVAIFAAFFAWEVWQRERAMLVMRLCAQRAVWVGSAFQFFYGASYFVGLYYLPIYFQSVRDVSPSDSGVRNLPLVLAFGISSITGGLALSRYGYAVPMMAGGSCLATVACGCFYTLGGSTTTGQWIGFQILAGVAWGVCWQCTMAVAQEGQKPEHLPSITSIILLFQILGGAFGISIAQCAFNNTMIQNALSNLPGIDASLLLGTGATEIRKVFSAQEIDGIVDAYIAGLRVVWGLMVGFAGSAFVVGLMSHWRRLYQDPDSKPATQHMA
ncbi:MFS general substrate transporter [Mytilinidion resinicola]|uniref:MFS general substrate transporter n=1 Tax=Mytilinidion resinicola TaxID=574789 RepID=A0A6A6Y056_9PEZI|nr:MFS general substrate transporter [Mytilinidion resinicola]KAF2802191.1 MFS general substrate transporter [Mytilinidion resinicola]